MAWTAPSTWVAGAILTAAQLNTQLRDNMLAGGPIYATEALRDAAIPSPFEGQRAYITGSTVAAATGANTAVPTGITTIYNGTSWVCTTPVGAYTDTNGTTTSTTATATLTSGGTNPSVTLTTGTTALVQFSMGATAAVAPTGVNAGFAVSGASTIVTGNNISQYSVVTSSYFGTLALSMIITGLTAGTNTFTLNYYVSANTGQFYNRRIVVQGIA
jgi:hypothetical protein